MLKNHKYKFLFKAKPLSKSQFFKDDRLPFVEARFVLNSKEHYTKHFHETLSIGAIEKGEVLYVYKHEKFSLKPDGLAVINPYEIHSCNPQDKRSRTYHMTYIDEKWCKQVQESIFGEIPAFLPVFKANINDKILYEQYLKLNYILLDAEYLYIEKELMLYGFLVNLFSTNCKNIKISKKVEKYPKNIVEKTKNFMKKNLEYNLTIEDLSKNVGLSEFYFIRAFKEATSITPHAYFLNLKVIEAKKMLKNGLDISQVALEVGFFDQSHLNRVFKAHVAATPYRYKKDVFTR